MAEKKFETSFHKLEKIVDKLESEELPLEDSLRLYEEGVKLSGFCAKKLEEAEKKVQKLSRNSAGKLIAEETNDFEAQPDEKGSEA